ncbi:hypothetical protein ACI2L1_28615 [Streptomyces sp. NPDC019531]|uniref:hypothetical protein n=1 Tax=Streptomyces sp. NPDC019531 TaxID=3365062 RepID=UPI003851604B
MSFTTPPRPLDVTALFPQLAPLARTATRLHPRPGSPTVHDSSVGGPLLWPADEPWPHCEGPHDSRVTRVVHSPDDIRAFRRRGVAAAERRARDPQAPTVTPEELEAAQRFREGRPWFDGPIAMMPVAQLYARDVPLPGSPPEADLLQVLWCPFDHASAAHPRTALFWRSSASVTDVLDAPPEPPVIQSNWYLPEPCLLAPEQVTEYPNPMELSKELQEELGDVSRWETAGSAWDSTAGVTPQEFYFGNLCHAPGWKTGGWTRWGLTDPMPRPCPECGTEATPLLTIACAEWDSDSESWRPEEERTNPTPLLIGTPPANFTLLDIAGGYDLQLHVCPKSPDHPHIELVQ